MILPLRAIRESRFCYVSWEKTTWLESCKKSKKFNLFKGVFTWAVTPDESPVISPAISSVKLHQNATPQIHVFTCEIPMPKPQV